MRSLLATLPLALAFVACAGPRADGAASQLATERAAAPPSSSEPRPWQPTAGAPKIECRWDAQVETQPGPALEAACSKDPTCGCAALGHALLMASAGAVETRTLEVLDGACHRGVLVSCNEASMVEELCVRGTARPSSACDVLQREGRVGSAEMQAR